MASPQPTAAWSGPVLIGTDTGGTFTDCVIAGPHGLTIGKALSTPGELWRGIIDSIADAAKDIGGVDEILGRASVLAHGTTAMLNATLTGAGASVGIITTAGFEDTLAIGRVHQKVAGLAEWEMTNLAKLRKSALFRDKRLIAGVRERTDAQGRILEPLDAAEIRQAAERLQALGATAFAVNFLWSCVNPENEQAAARAIREALPGVRVSCSSDLSNTVGEYERFATCALNAYIVDIADGYLDALAGELRRRGFDGRLLVTRAWGDLERAELVAKRAVPSLFSGPIGGVVGARGLTRAALDELPVILCADLGGTSLDVAVIHGGNVHWNRHPTIERLHLSVPTFEVASIGTGGGSIASYDADLGLVHVGPESAGSVPGPACYQRGGVKPTLTDAALVAGWLPPGSRMPGGIELSARHSSEAIDQEIARPAGMSTATAASAILRIACAQMADLVRKSCIERAVDPRQAVPLVYGGAGAQYAGAICAELGVTRFLVPELASGFSAFGMLGAEEGAVVTRSVHRVLPVDPVWLESVFADMEAPMRRELDGDPGTSVQRFAELRYNQQSNELRVAIPETGDAGWDLGAAFTAAYEQRYGAGSADASNAIELTAAVVRAARPIAQDRPLAQRARADAGEEASASARMLWIDGTEHDAPVTGFAAAREPGGVAGPAIVTGNYTSVVVPPGWRARWRDDLNMLEVSVHG
ncbi:hydantoinase/oxoprolinase family protein [Caulobacter sp. LARHSG274]